MTVTESGSYIFDNATDEAAKQVRLLAEILDPHSFEVLTRAGVRAGWSCLDLGAGAGTVTAWLASQVAPNGRVVAIDTDPRHIAAGDSIEVRTGDVTTTDLGDGEYDLVHARLLLMHLPEREQVLRRVIAALRPGGVLVVTDWDCTHTDEMLLRGADGVAGAFAAFQRTLIQMAMDAGASMDWARRVYAVMREAGLTNVSAVKHNRVWNGGQAGCALHACNSRQLEKALLARGLSPEQLTSVRAGMADLHTQAWSYDTVTTIGRRPVD